MYQMPPGLRICLPRSWQPSVASSTRTTSSFSPGFKASVMSKREGRVAAGVLADFLAVDPDVAAVIDGLEVQQRPAVGVAASHRTCGDTRGLRRSASNRCTPESFDSKQNGTRILPSHFAGCLGDSIGVTA